MRTNPLINTFYRIVRNRRQNTLSVRPQISNLFVFMGSPPPFVRFASLTCVSIGIALTATSCLTGRKTSRHELALFAQLLVKPRAIQLSIDPLVFCAFDNWNVLMPREHEFASCLSCNYLGSPCHRARPLVPERAPFDHSYVLVCLGLSVDFDIFI